MTASDGTIKAECTSVHNLARKLHVSANVWAISERACQNGTEVGCGREALEVGRKAIFRINQDSPRINH